MTIPDSDWQLCRSYKATLVERVKDLETCTKEGKEVRKKRDECVGELAPLKVREAECAGLVLELRSDLAVERAKKPALFWVAAGGFVVSVLWVAVEVLGAEPLELPKVVAGSAVAAGSAGIVVLTW